jgi:hypothetical protein
MRVARQPAVPIARVPNSPIASSNHAVGDCSPKNLTLSRSEVNESECVDALSHGVNVAVVFAGQRPTQWHGFDTIDGDAHDLRHLDPKGPRGVVMALSPKGPRAKKRHERFRGAVMNKIIQMPRERFREDGETRGIFIPLEKPRARTRALSACLLALTFDHKSVISAICHLTKDLANKGQLSVGARALWHGGRPPRTGHLLRS